MEERIHPLPFKKTSQESHTLALISVARIGQVSTCTCKEPFDPNLIWKLVHEADEEGATLPEGDQAS